MLRYVVKLEAVNKKNPDDEQHLFETFEEAEGFARANKYRYIECYSEERKVEGKHEFWKRGATYEIYEPKW